MKLVQNVKWVFKKKEYDNGSAVSFSFHDSDFNIKLCKNYLNNREDNAIIILLLLPCSQAVRHQTLTLTCVSSNLTRATK